MIAIKYSREGAILAAMTDPVILLPYLIFCALMTGTPGPNNAMALTAGARVGYLRSLPLIAGIAVGVGVMIVAVGLGLGAAFNAWPPLHTLLRIGGSAYLIWLAVKIARSGPVRPGGTDRAPLGFGGAVAFQWINPKAWAITSSAVATYVPEGRYSVDVPLAALIIVIVSMFTVSTWAAGGTVLRRYLIRPRFAHAFNLTVAILLGATTVSILMGD